MYNLRQNLENRTDNANALYFRPSSIQYNKLMPGNKTQGHSRTISDKQNYNRHNDRKQNKSNTNKNNSILQRSNDKFKKPLISPCHISNFYQSRRHSGYQQNDTFEYIGENYCSNHTNKPAEFYLLIQQENLGYCKKCAVKLASQGFTVSKIKKNELRQQQEAQLMKRLVPKRPEYQLNPKYCQTYEFLVELQKIESEHLLNMQKLQRVDSLYKQQISHTEHYYSELLEFIQKMRQDHLFDLHKERRRHTQIAYIEHDYLRENVQQMSSIWSDIETNIDNIALKMDDEEVNTTLRYYKQKIYVYRHKIDEMVDFFSKVIKYEHWEYQQKLEKVEDFLMKVWLTGQFQNKQNSIQQHASVQNHQIRVNGPPKSQQEQLVKPSNLVKNLEQPNCGKFAKGNPTQTAFRMLFLEDQQEPGKKNISSPQFKQI